MWKGTSRKDEFSVVSAVLASLTYEGSAWHILSTDLNPYYNWASVDQDSFG